MNSDLYDHPALYDALLPVGAHLPYYAELARQASGDILELACGTGQLTVPLASAGLRIAGLDLSEPMLSTARGRAATQRSPWSTCWVTCATSVWAASLHSFSSRATPCCMYIRSKISWLPSRWSGDTWTAGGIFAFDIFNPNVRLLARPSGQRFPAFQKETQSFGTLSVEETTDYDPATQVGRGRWYVSAPGNPDAGYSPLQLRNIFPQELPLLVAAGGFNLTSRAGGFCANAIRFLQPLASVRLSCNDLSAYEGSGHSYGAVLRVLDRP